jgi:hypothetical protein
VGARSIQEKPVAEHHVQFTLPSVAFPHAGDTVALLGICALCAEDAGELKLMFDCKRLILLKNSNPEG